MYNVCIYVYIGLILNMYMYVHIHVHVCIRKYGSTFYIGIAMVV